MPVVSVGNLTFGGTGKTPCVLYLLEELARPGRTLGVASRGYRGVESVFRGSIPAGVGDEAALVAGRNPEVWIATAANRVRAVRSLAREGVSVVIADDAFQHRKLRRCFDLVLLDAARPFGNGRILPAGMLREPPQALRRADAVVLMRTDEAGADQLARTLDSLRSILGEKRERELVFRARSDVVRWHVRTAGTTSIAPAPSPHGRVLAFCGIGSPESFRSTLLTAGLDVIDLVDFPDHHKFAVSDLTALEERAVREGIPLACTEKDLQNLPERAVSVAIHVPELLFRVEEGDRLLGLIERRLAEDARRERSR